jgi:hypothetical protein
MDALDRVQSKGRFVSWIRGSFKLGITIRISTLIVLLGVNACGAGGGSAQMPPGALSYPSPAIARVGRVENFAPTASGVVTGYTVSPALPSGLTLDSSSGVISGSAAGPQAQTRYTLTAHNQYGSTSFTWMLSVDASAPTDLSYSSPITALVGVPLTAAPSVTGSVTGYAISPALPTGLSIDPTSGVISGTPTTVSPQATYTVTASNSTGKVTFGLMLTVTTSVAEGSQPPTGLSYSSPLTAVVSVPLTVAPSVSGSVTNYAVSPALPAGLTLDPMAGVISGAPAAPSAQTTYTITASNAQGHASFGLRLTVSAASTVPSQAPAGLSYSSPLTAVVGVPFSASPTVSGAITSYSVSPSLPAGLSLNSITGIISGSPLSAASKTTYLVRASNSAGSTTFDWVLGAVNPAPPMSLSYPNPATPFLVGVGSLTLTPTVTGQVSQFSINPALPSGLAINPSSGVIYSPSGQAPAAPSSAHYTVTASNAGGSTTYALTLAVDSGPTVALTVTPTAGSAPLTYYWKTTDGQLLNSNGTVLTVTTAQGSTVNWMLPQGKGLHFAYVLARDAQSNCYEARAVVDSDSFGAPQPATNPTVYARLNYGNLISCTTLTDPFFSVAASNSTSSQPQTNAIGSITATYGGTVNGVAIYNSISLFQQVYPSFLQFEPAGLLQSISSMSEQSNAYQASGTFFFGAQNDAVDACNYYGLIGALGPGQPDQFCDANGNPTNPSTVTNLSTWVGNYPFATSDVEGPVYFVNVMDLNLTREHYSVIFAQGNANEFAAYVCNHLGPLDGSNRPMTVNPTLNPNAPANTPAQQAAIDQAVLNAAAGSNLVACVAMDFAVINGYQYTRFYAFGPSGELLPSVNLDGRGEKYVPGACTACHGGNYAYEKGQTALSTDLDAYFLPYDAYNFAFSGSIPYSEQQLYVLNTRLLYGSTPAGSPTYPQTPASPGTISLVNNWYGTSPSTENSPCLGYVPPTWGGTSTPPGGPCPPTPANPSIAYTAYTSLIARGCRTCHTALPSVDWDSLGPSALTTDGAASAVCPPNSPAMPNSLVTFNRFWDSGSPNLYPALGPSQVSAFLDIYIALGLTVPGCNPPFGGYGPLISPTHPSAAHPSSRSHSGAT